MPPHCDSMDGPVVTAAREAIAAHDVRRVLPYVKRDGEDEVREAFARVLEARNGNPAANNLADLYFFETVVRVHRAGEGAPFTGLKPAGLPVGPVVPVAERAIERRDSRELLDLLHARLDAEVGHRFEEVLERQPHADEGVEPARAYVEATLGLIVWSNGVYACLGSGAHGHGVNGHGAHGHAAAAVAEAGAPHLG